MTIHLGPYRSFLYSKTAIKIAKICKVEPRTIYKWRSGKTLPTPHNMQHIVRKTKGRVSYKDMIEFYLKHN